MRGGMCTVPRRGMRQARAQFGLLYGGKDHRAYQQDAFKSLMSYALGGWCDARAGLFSSVQSYPARQSDYTRNGKTFNWTSIASMPIVSQSGSFLYGAPPDALDEPTYADYLAQNPDADLVPPEVQYYSAGSKHQRRCQ